MKKILQIYLLLLFMPLSLLAQVDSSVYVVDTIPENMTKTRLDRAKRNIVVLDTAAHPTDSVKPKKVHYHNPKVASCLSIIPGGGQIYNKKWWKLPIVYGGMGVATYFVCDFGKQFVELKKEYKNRINGDVELLLPEYELKTDDQIKGLRDSYRSRMEISIAALSILYLLNIVDACVDAHLFYFDVSDDLSLRVTPQIQSQPYSAFTPSVGLTFNFR